MKPIMNNYQPLSHSFELPVQKILAHCITNKPISLPPHEGSTPGTTLAGAFGNALWAAICLNNPSCDKQQQGNPHCKKPQDCILPWLYKPYSEVHHRNFARPVLLRAAELESLEPVKHFTLEVTLWGRHAIAAQQEVIATLKKMGNIGLNSNNSKVAFQITQIEIAPALTLTEQIKTLPKNINSILLEFQTPFLHQERTPEGKRYFHTQAPLPIVNILGNIAYNLVAWDIEDRNIGEKLDNKQRHNLARDARDVAWKAGKELTIVRTHLSPVFIGKRLSRTNQQTMSLEGFVGLVELAGNLKAAIPWLQILALIGGGQKRTMGFGAVQMWFNF
jgi:hypothetical protein